jgi:preprotein translocase subunit SecG
MRASSISGAVFVLLAALLVVDVLVADGIRSASGAGASMLLAALGVSWFLGLWGALVAAMFFLITWVMEGMNEEPSGGETSAGAAHR